MSKGIARGLYLDPWLALQKGMHPPVWPLSGSAVARLNSGVLCGSDSRFRCWLFAPITFDHELKVGPVSLFLEVEQKTVLRYGTKPKRFVVRDFSTPAEFSH